MEDFYINTIEVYTDGANKPNPGKSGCGFTIIYPGEEPENISSVGFKKSTINRAELTACIEALKHIKKDVRSYGIPSITIYSDSQYVVDGYKNLHFKGSPKKWKLKDGTDSANTDLWKKLFTQARGMSKKIDIRKVQAHSGIEHNETADKLAKKSRENISKKEDSYMKRIQTRRWLKIKENKKPMNIEKEKTIIIYIQSIKPETTSFKLKGQILKPICNKGYRMEAKGILGIDTMRGGHIYKVKIKKEKEIIKIEKIIEDLGKVKENEDLIANK